MPTSNYQKLKQNEKHNRKTLVKIIMYGLILAIILVFVAVFWLTQPLISSFKLKNSNVLIKPEKLETHVRKLSEDFHPRNFANKKNLNATADYIKEEFTKSGGKVSEQPFRDGKNEYRNIIVSFGEESTDRIVIGAHYDSCYDTPGADDNASGVAGLIELAHLFGKQKTSMQIELVAYTLEEPPFFSTEQMGSFVHAKSLKDKNAKVRLMISLEMIGYFSDVENSQNFPVSIMKLLYPSRGNFISIVGNFTNVFTVRKLKGLMSSSTDLPVYSINAPTFIPGIDFSDHKNYWENGFDAVMITDTSFYRNHNYHTTKDTAETLNYVKMAKVVKATFDAVNHLSEN